MRQKYPPSFLTHSQSRTEARIHLWRADEMSASGDARKIIEIKSGRRERPTTSTHYIGQGQLENQLLER
jgi:hypothetical protein